MTKANQLALVRQLSKGIFDDVAMAILDGRVPQEWDGHELRALMEYKYAEAASRSCINTDRRNHRAKAFRNHLMISGL